MNSQTVFITGASSGIGEACAIKFAQQGYNLILNSRRADKLETLKQEYGNFNCRLLQNILELFQ